MSERARKRRSTPVLMAIGQWQPGQFMEAGMASLEWAEGHLAGGLAMRMLFPSSPKGRVPPIWGVTHLGSGHRVCLLKAHQDRAFALADGLLRVSDWSFDGLDGWRNIDPDLRDKFADWARRQGKDVVLGSGGQWSHDMAQVVAQARA